LLKPTSASTHRRHPESAAKGEGGRVVRARRRAHRRDHGHGWTWKDTDGQAGPQRSALELPGNRRPFRPIASSSAPGAALLRARADADATELRHYSEFKRVTASGVSQLIGIFTEHFLPSAMYAIRRYRPLCWIVSIAF
jgi:hypothetical protein